MINGLIKIELFTLLDTIRHRHKVMDKDWAKVAGLEHGSRISELRAIAQNRRVVADRAFHFAKFKALLTGLQSLLGEETVRKELTDLLSKTKDKKEKMILLASIVPEDKEDQVIAFLEMVAETSSTSKK